MKKIKGTVSAIIYLEKQKSEKSLKKAVDTVLELVKGESPEQLRMFKEALNRIDGAFSRRNQETAVRKLPKAANYGSKEIEAFRQPVSDYDDIPGTELS